MATKMTINLEDDIDGGPAEETLRFSFGGTEYEIDLNATNARAFRQQLAPFIDHSRKADTGQRRGAAGSGRARTGDVRAWAKRQGFEVSDRGRLSATLTEQYEKAIRRR